MINAANLVYSLYVFSLPFGPIWALHTFYLVSCAIMLVLCLGQRRVPCASLDAPRHTERAASTTRAVELMPPFQHSSTLAPPAPSHGITLPRIPELSGPHESLRRSGGPDLGGRSAPCCRAGSDRTSVFAPISDSIETL